MIRISAWVSFFLSDFGYAAGLWCLRFRIQGLRVKGSRVSVLVKRWQFRGFSETQDVNQVASAVDMECGADEFESIRLRDVYGLREFLGAEIRNAGCARASALNKL